MGEFSLALNEDQLQIQKWVHEFAERVVRPAAAEWDEREETPWPVIQEAAKIGLYSWEAMAQFFADPTGLTMGIVNEELFWGDAGLGLSIFGSCLGAVGILNNGTPEQIATWIPQCFGTAEDVKLAAFCVTEPNAGSDVSSLRTRAVRDGDDWVLNGQKCFITNGGIADVHVVVATVDPSLGARGQASFIVPPGTPGLTQGKKERKMGIRASHTAEVLLDDVRLPAECLLGGEEKLEARLARAREGGRTATQAAMRTFEASRPVVGAQAVGIARAAYEFALEYAKERTQFGRPIIENQAIAFKLADMATKLRAARLLTRDAAERYASGQRADLEAGMAKLFASEMAFENATEAMRIHGGYGYTTEFPIERYYRDAPLMIIGEGTNEIQRLVIARGLLERYAE